MEERILRVGPNVRVGDPGGVVADAELPRQALEHCRDAEVGERAEVGAVFVENVGAVAGMLGDAASPGVERRQHPPHVHRPGAGQTVGGDQVHLGQLETRHILGRGVEEPGNGQAAQGVQVLDRWGGDRHEPATLIARLGAASSLRSADLTAHTDGSQWAGRFDAIFGTSGRIGHHG